MLPLEELARLIDEERRQRTVRHTGQRPVRRGGGVTQNLRTLNGSTAFSEATLLMRSQTPPIR